MLPVIEITVNGELRKIARGLTVAGLLAELGLGTRPVSVERNQQSVPRAHYDCVRLSGGDFLVIDSPASSASP